MIHIEQLARAGLVLALGGAVGVAALPATAQSEHAPGRVLVQFKPTATAEQVRTAVSSANAQILGEIPHTGVKVLKLSANANESAIAAALAKRGEVAFTELDQRRKPDAVPNDPSFASEWHLQKIAAPTAWNTTAGSATIIVAILDTGCDPTHPDLKANYVAGWNFYDNTSDTHDVFGHGTATAGTAAAAVNNGIGVSGVAGNCKIMPCRISDTSGYGYYSTVSSALTWAADHGARVANISYQMSESSTVQSAAQYFQNKGGVVAISAGNSSLNNTAADNPYALTVSATNSADGICSWSNYGNNIDLAAPGDSILTTCNGGGYGYWSGTSFSAPIVAGTAALVLSANPGLTGAQAQDILKKSADDLGAAGWDNQYGWGRVNASKAVAMATATTGAPAGDTTPPSVSFSSPAGGATVSGTVSLSANATDNVGVTSVSFYVDGSLVASDTSSPYSVSWNTSSVANGAHTLMVKAYDAANNMSSATMNVNVSNIADTSAPSVSIVTPAATITVGNSLSVSVSATDNVGVTKVELWVDGKLMSTDSSNPWSFSMNTRKWARGTHTLQSKGYDAAGNCGASQIVTVTK